MSIHDYTGGHALGAQTSCFHKCTTHEEKQRKERGRCVRELQSLITGQYTTVLDPLAGAGDDAMLLSPNTVVNDFDPTAVEVLRKKFSVVTDYDLSKDAKIVFTDRYDLIYLDFNTYTLHKFDKRVRGKGLSFGKVTYHDIMDLAFTQADKFVIVNDCSIHGYRLYPKPCKGCYEAILGCALSTVDDLFAALPAYYKRFYPDWGLTDHVTTLTATPRGNEATSYLLFRKARNPNS